MGIDLDTLEQRMIGSLIEKELTTPEQYPLSVNALVAACNQKSNRDPKMNVEDYDVEGAIRSLMDKGWVTRREMHGSRVMRYAHEAGAQLGVTKADLAILCELLCRGPQAPGALKTRCSRMHPFASADEVEERLAEMSLRPVPYVVELERQMRERHARWQHMLSKSEQSLEVAPNLEPTPHTEAEPLPEPLPEQAHAPAAAPVAPVASAPAPSQPVPSADMEARLERLEDRVEELVDRLDRLEGR